MWLSVFFFVVFLKSFFKGQIYISSLRQISPEDIQWEGEDPGISRHGNYGGSGRGMNRPVGRDSAPGAGRGRGLTKPQSRKGFPPSQNGGKKGSDDIQLLQTETLIKEVSNSNLISVAH